MVLSRRLKCVQGIAVALALLLVGATPQITSANGLPPTTADCAALAYSFPSRTNRLLFLPQSAVQTCLHYGWRDGNDGMGCYSSVLYQQFTENWVYTQHDIEGRYNDCLAVAYGFLQSSSQQYSRDLSTPDSPGQAMVFPWDYPRHEFVSIRTGSDPYHFVQAFVALP